MLSVVIPTLNEAKHLSATIAAARGRAGGEAIEIIVSDCNSSDTTREVAQALGARVVCGGMCRADACNMGASVARGDVLLFLHADTLIPDDYAQQVRRALRWPDIVGGAFNFTFSDMAHLGFISRMKLRLVMLCNHVRYRWSRNFFGDQAIFVRAKVYQAIGGFPQRSLLEDLHFSRRMSHCGRTAILSPAVQTSPRRFIARGIILQLLLDMAMLSCDSFGRRPQRMWHQYNALNRGLPQVSRQSIAAAAVKH